MRLLIADDHRDSAESLAEFLQLTLPPPVEIVLASDGQEALQATVEGALPFDAVITDIEMPRMNGISAAIGIKAACAESAPVLIAMTGHSELVKVALAKGVFDHVLVKPVDVEALLLLLVSVMQLALEKQVSRGAATTRGAPR